MTTEIGLIRSISGTVSATTILGEARNLQLGEAVYAGELIATEADGLTTIEFTDGSVRTLGKASQLTLDRAVFDPNTTAESSEQAANVEAIQQAILAGADPSQVAEATAAGAGNSAGNEGHSAVYVDYLAPEVTPESGFDTIGVSTTFPDTQEEELQATIVKPEVAQAVPIISISTSVEGGRAVEGEAVTFTVNQDIISSADTTVTVEILSLAADSATEGLDYQVIDTITVLIPAGSNLTTFDVATHVDALQEGDETFTARIVSASNPNGSVDIGTATALGTILDSYDSPAGGDRVHLAADESLIIDTIVNNSLTFTAGTADLTFFKFDTDLSSLKLDTNEDGVDDVTWHRISDTEIEGHIGSSIAVTLTLTASTITAGATADVSVQAVLDDAFSHLAIPGRNPLDLGYVTITASTTAGDNVIGTAYLAVVDDIIEITSISNANLANVVGAEANGDLVIDTGEDGLASLTFSGVVPLGLTTSSGHEISYQPLADGSLQAVDENDQTVFLLSQNATDDGYTLALDQLLQGSIVETTIELTGATVEAGAPVGSITQVSQNGITINLSATDNSGADTINASSDGYGVDNGLVEEGDAEIVTIALGDPNGTFSDMSIEIGNFSTTGNGTDVYSYQLYLDGSSVGTVQSVTATATNSSTNTTVAINDSGFDEIRMWATHSGGNDQTEGSYKIISVDSDVTATSNEDVILNFGVDAVDSDGDYHGGDFQIAVDISGDSSYLLMDTPSLDQLINDGVEDTM